jgi:putative intracellular protease/amidase
MSIMTAASTNQRILIVVTSHNALGDTGRPTGFHWEELATPYWLFKDAGFDVALASIRTGVAPQDPNSFKDDPAARPAGVQRFVDDSSAMAALRSTPAVAEFDASDYAAVFLPGGHGTMWDFPTSEPLAQLLGKAFDRGAVIGAVCHGPAGLVTAKRADGQPIVSGRRVNAFTDAEERAVNADSIVPFLLESRLRELGARFEGGSNFQPYVVRDGNLVTGQNPQSALMVAQQVLAALEAPVAAAA